MRRSLRFVLGWLAAVVAAVGLSWAVIRDAVDPGLLGGGSAGGAAEVTGPAAVGEPTARTVGPVPAGPGSGTSASPGRRAAQATGPAGTTAAGSRTPARTPGAPTAPAAASPAARDATPATAPGAPAAPSASAGVRSYPVTGGRVVLQLTDSLARLVSATPEAGYRVQSWEADGWLRVDFSLDGTTRSSVFATWNGTPPTVTTTTY